MCQLTHRALRRRSIRSRRLYPSRGSCTSVYVGPLTQAQASGRRINVFLGRGKLMQSLSFDDVPGSQTARLKGVSSVALGTEAPGSDNLMVCF